MEFRRRYKKLIDLIMLLLIITVLTLTIKYYFKPFIWMVIMFLIANPLYKFFIRLNIHDKIAGALSILFVNLALIIFVIYLGGSIFILLKKLYEGNIKLIEDLIRTYIGFIDVGDGKSIAGSVISILNQDFIKTGAITTGEGIVAFFIGNICAFFILVDREKMKDLVKRLIPRDILYKAKYQGGNFKQMIGIQVILVLISTLEIIIGFIVFRVPKAVLLGVICGILDILPYVGTIIVFVPIIIYNIIVEDYIVAFGLICLYILVQVIREVLEAKFLSDKLELHPLLVLLSIYIGIKLFGILGIVVGPMYGILAKDIIYGEDK
ncbi:MAG: AI-2E family transporter [Clostridium paraputrificum]